MPDLPNLDDLLPYAGFAAICALNVVIIGAAFVFGYLRRQATIRAWDELAMRAGLTLERGSWFTSPSLSGEYRRRPLRLWTFTRGSSKNRVTYTQIEITVDNTTGSTLGISPSNAISDFFGKLFNAQDVQIGNPEFDARFTIKSDPPDFAMVALDDSMTRMGIAEIAGGFDIRLQGASLAFTERGLTSDADRLERLFNTLSDLADRVEGKRRGAF